MEINNVIDVTTTGLQQLGTIIIISQDYDLIWVTCWLAICFAGSTFVYMIAATFFVSRNSLLPGYFSSAINRNAAFSGSMMCISVLAMLQSQGDKLVVSKLLPLGVFGYYAFASGIVSRAAVLSSSITQAAFPAFSALAHKASDAEILAQYRKLQDFLCFASAMLFAIIPFAVGPFLRYMFNGDIERMLLVPIILLTVGLYINGTVHVPYIVSLSLGKPEITAQSHLYALIISLPMTVMLTARFGLVGAGLSLVIHDAVLYVYWVPRICVECLGIRPSEWYLHVAKVFILIAMTYGIAGLILNRIGSHSIVSLGIAYVVSSIFFALSSYIVIGNGLRLTIVDKFRELKVMVFSGSKWISA